MPADYLRVRDWLEGFIPHVWTRKELGLERISYLLKLLGNPQNKFKSIHIAGTSGKGSTAFLIAKLLQESGKSEIRNPKSETNKKAKHSKSKYSFENSHFDIVSSFDIRASNFPMKVGLHISPHLVDIRERMQVFGSRKSEVRSQTDSLMPVSRFIKLMNEVRDVVEKIQKSKPELTPSYFEILVAASFLYFAKEKVDWAVVEVGLGGRLDATNILKPDLSVITNIGLDHTDILGKSEEKIAYEKAGIIKVGVPVVTGCPSTHFVRSGSLNLHNSSGSSRKALEVIQKAARQKKAPLITINTQSYKKAVKSEVFNNINLPIDIFRSTPYSFASSNKLLALAAVKTLGITLSKVKVTKAFNSTFPGRFEEIEKGVIIDGAHNPQKIKFLINFLRKFEVRSSKFEVILVVGFKKGKDWKKMVDLLIKNLPVSKVTATKFHAVTDMGKHQAVEPKEIAKYIKSKWKVKVESQKNSHEAAYSALTSNGYTTNQLTLITGSLYLVGEARAIWKIPQI